MTARVKNDEFGFCDTFIKCVRIGDREQAVLLAQNDERRLFDLAETIVEKILFSLDRQTCSSPPAYAGGSDNALIAGYNRL